MTSLTWVSNFLPKAPPGCERAKSSGRNPRASSRATAKASPMASCAVVLAVGAKLSGQASCSTLQSSTTSAWRASSESRLPVSAISATCWRRRAGSKPVSSSLCPLLEMASNTSWSVIMPKSPWLASAGCTNIAGVPVEASVAAILRPIWPLLPMPITTTRPRQASKRSIARTKEGPTRCPRACTAAASMAKVCRAKARHCWACRCTGSDMPAF